MIKSNIIYIKLTFFDIACDIRYLNMHLLINQRVELTDLQKYMLKTHKIKISLFELIRQGLPVGSADLTENKDFILI